MKTAKRNALKVAMTVWKKFPIPDFGRKYITLFTNKKFLTAVQGIIFNDDGEVLLFHHTYRKIPWGIPSGWLGYEQPYEGLQREVFEESGLRIQIDKVEKVTFVKNIYGVRSIDILLLGKFQGGVFAPSAEVDQYMFCKVGDWPDGMRNDQKAMLTEILSK